jgi:hypothetical protein
MNMLAGSPDASDTNKPMYDSPTIAKIAGIEQQVLLGWRRRHDFLGGPKEGAQGSGGYLHSLIDALVIVAVAAMVRRGLDVANAVAAESELRLAFEMMANKAGGDPDLKNEVSTIFGYHPQGRDPKTRISFYFLSRKETLDEVMKKTSALYLLDLQPIMATVLKRLKVSHLVNVQQRDSK